MIAALSTFGLLVGTAVAQVGLTAQPFQLVGSSAVNNVKLAWNINNGATSYNVQRKTGSAGYSTIATVVGNTYDDYDLSTGVTYQYQVTSSQGTSNEANAATFAPSGSFSIYNNTELSTLRKKSNIFVDNVYYQYNYVVNSDSTFYIQQQTSSDGYDFSGDTSVLNSATVCASVGNASSCHLERTSFNLNPNTGDVVMWAHLENNENYDLAQVAAASGPPGSAFTFDGTYRPLGYDSRDMCFFADDNSESTGYIISATDTNTNMNIYQLTSNWTAVSSLAAEVLVNQYREAPSMVKIDGLYYLFTSRAAGWYPSLPEYISSSSITSGWSEPFVSGNAATNAAQSGTVVSLGNSYAMLPDRWGANWSPVSGVNREYMLPLSTASGYAVLEYYQSTMYRDSGSVSGESDVYGVQTGRILSVGRPTTSTPSGGTNLTLANDGVQNNPNAYFTPASVPFTWQVDLGATYTISQVDLSTNMVQGSETYYQYTITASSNGNSYTTIANMESNTVVGFVPVFFNNVGPYRYINISVSHVINTHNGNEADVFAGVVEATVYGS